MTNHILYVRCLIQKNKDEQCDTLDLGNCNIDDLSHFPELFECTHLKTLILSNYWEEVAVSDDGAVGSEMQFSKNNIGLNCIDSLPNEISKLVNLENLYCDAWHSIYPRITDLSPLRELPNLKVLRIEHNDVTDLSPLNNISTLKKVYTRGNKRLSLADHYAKFPNTKYSICF